jgi:hypothetical protein
LQGFFAGQVCRFWTLANCLTLQLENQIGDRLCQLIAGYEIIEG